MERRDTDNTNISMKQFIEHQNDDYSIMSSHMRNKQNQHLAKKYQSANFKPSNGLTGSYNIKKYREEAEEFMNFQKKDNVETKYSKFEQLLG